MLEPYHSFEGFKIKDGNNLLSQMKYTLAVNQRKIFLYDGVDEDSIFECIYYLYKLMDIDSKISEKKPIYIMINSNGGNVYDCLTLVSLIEHMKDIGYEIITVNMGRAFSAGFIISIIGSKRIAYKYSDYMVHDISTMCLGKLQEIKEDVEETERLRKKLYGIITKYTKLKEEDLIGWHERKLDKYFNSNESLKLCICDSIL